MARSWVNRAQQLPRPDLRVYLITDPGLTRGRSLESVVEAAIAGGVTAVQLRDKAATTLELVQTGRRFRAITRAPGVLFLFNDRVDVALAVGADGVHVGHPGKEDMPPELCRKLLGARAIVGVSVDHPDEAKLAAAAGASYLSAGPVFSTRTKPDAGPPAGLELIRRIRAASPLPLTGIGGIGIDTVAAVVAAGADGVAVAGAILAADDPQTAARALRAAVDLALAQRLDGRSRMTDVHGAR